MKFSLRCSTSASLYSHVSWLSIFRKSNHVSNVNGLMHVPPSSYTAVALHHPVDRVSWCISLGRVHLPRETVMHARPQLPSFLRIDTFWMGKRSMHYFHTATCAISAADSPNFTLHVFTFLVIRPLFRFLIDHRNPLYFKSWISNPPANCYETISFPVAR